MNASDVALVLGGMSPMFLFCRRHAWAFAASTALSSLVAGCSPGYTERVSTGWTAGEYYVEPGARPYMPDRHSRYAYSRASRTLSWREARRYDQLGPIAYSGSRFDGRRTASGEIYDMYAMTAAHPSLPFGAMVEVTNQRNGRRAILRINDRRSLHKGRLLSVSRTAARDLGFARSGVAWARVRFVGRASEFELAPAAPEPRVRRERFDHETSDEDDWRSLREQEEAGPGIDPYGRPYRLRPAGP